MKIKKEMAYNPEKRQKIIQISKLFSVFNYFSINNNTLFGNNITQYTQRGARWCSG